MVVETGSPLFFVRFSRMLYGCRLIPADEHHPLRRIFLMLKLDDGNCGLCQHFGEEHPEDPKLVQIRVHGEGPEDYTDMCGHPSHASLNLVVSPNSGCQGFTPVKKAG
ncbi:MAG: hypothetical protein AAGB34_00285 [Planctomycetota bacterium]